jgi:hypothetical protein
MLRTHIDAAVRHAHHELIVESEKFYYEEIFCNDLPRGR